jgi:formate C-acetyltransferase
MTTHKGFGNFVGALPSGRKAFETFANGLAPCDGWDTQGPTACLNSISKLDYAQATNGVAVNLKLSPVHLVDTEGTHNLSSLVRGYFDSGGMHLQLNLIDRQTLVDAQQEPEKHASLMVRVAGYSAYFVDLTKAVQDEVISRTEHAVP